MIATMLCCFTGAAAMTAGVLETSIRRSTRRGQLQATNADLPALVEVNRVVEPTSRVATPTGNAELYSLAAYRAVHRSTAQPAPLPEGHLAEVVQVDFRIDAMPLRAARG